jgi:hypothetical protein
MNNYPNPFDLSDFKLRYYLKELIEFRVNMKLETSVINYEKFLPEIKISDDKEMERLNKIICEYVEELLYKRGGSI